MQCSAVATLQIDRRRCLVGSRHLSSSEVGQSSADTYRARDVEDDDCRGGAAVVHGGEAVVALLAGGVPDVELHGGLVQGQHLREEGGSDCRLLETNTSEYIKTRSGKPNHKYRSLHHDACGACLALVVEPFGEPNDNARLPGAQVPEKHLQTKSMALC